MNNFYLAATTTSPRIDFNFIENQLSIKGESYPENAAAFYGPVIQALRSYLDTCTDAHILLDVALCYFNSSSTKILYNIFSMLNDTACIGNRVTVHWYYDPEDDTMFDFGMELQGDYSNIELMMVSSDIGG